MPKFRERQSKQGPTTFKKEGKIYIDHLEEDKPIAGQRFFMASFVSPDGKQKSDIVGFKVKAVTDTYEEAQKRVEILKMVDDNFDIFIGPVGKWCPFNPNPDKIMDEKHQLDQLNELVGGQKQQQIKSTEYFNQRKQDAVKKAMEENMSKREGTYIQPKEPLVGLRQRIENLKLDVEDKRAQIEELEEKIKSDTAKLEEYTEEEIAEADRVEAEEDAKYNNNADQSGIETKVIDKEVDPQELKDMDDRFGDNIMTHSQRNSMKAAGEIDDKPELYEVHDYEKGKAIMEDMVKEN